MRVKRKTKPHRSVIATRQSHEAFCRAVADGMTQTNAYRLHVSDQSKHAHKQASALAIQHADRIAAIIAENNAIAAAARVLTKQEAMEFLTSVVRTPIAQVDADSPLCQERTVTADSVKIKMPGKREAISDLAKMLAWNATEKVDVTVNTHEDVQAALDKMFAKKRK